MGWKDKQTPEREFTKVIRNNLIVYIQNGKKYYAINNSALTENERRVIENYIFERR